MEQSKSDELEFEQFEGTEIKVSKGFRTDEGDTIRVMFTAGGIAMLLSDKKSNLPDIIVDDATVVDNNIAQKKSFWQRVWAWLKKVFGGGGGITVGPSCKLTSKIIWANGVPIGMMTTLTCSF
jgi:hypothetical protein